MESNTAPQGIRRDENLDILPHVISLGDNGELFSDGAFAKYRVDLEKDIIDSFREITKDWPTKRLVIYAHEGLVSAKGALKDIRPDLETLKKNYCYPLAIVWRTGPIETVVNLIKDEFGRKRGGEMGAPKQGLGELKDGIIEYIVRNTKVQDLWWQMKDNARLAAEQDHGGSRIACQIVSKLIQENPSLEIHLVSHSAGSILQGYFLDYLTGSTQEGKLGLRVASCSHWAPACTLDFFRDTYLPLISNGTISKYSIMTLNDRAEREDKCKAGFIPVYDKSLLYLVSRGFEKNPAKSDEGGIPLLGMELFLNQAGDLTKILRNAWTKTPSALIPGCKQHGSFSEDKDVLQATIEFITQSE